MENKKLTREQRNSGIIWTSSTEYYDIETGEQITKNKALSKEYYKVRITKTIKFNNNKTRGEIKYYGEYKRREQLSIGFAD